MAEYIEREVAVKAILDKEDREIKNDYEFCLGLIVASNAVSDVPAADVQPIRHGRWNEESPDCLDGDSVYVCSVCGETWTLIEGTPLDNNMHYCPNCGAKMDGGDT